MIRRILPAPILALSLAACATTAPPSPVEVTRFVAADTGTRLGTGTVFVSAEGGLETSAYSAAVARELQRLGYREGPRSSASQARAAAPNATASVTNTSAITTTSAGGSG